jgi:hypothetical protein
MPEATPFTTYRFTAGNLRQPVGLTLPLSHAQAARLSRDLGGCTPIRPAKNKAMP